MGGFDGEEIGKLRWKKSYHTTGFFLLFHTKWQCNTPLLKFNTKLTYMYMYGPELLKFKQP